jgi:hypothetical protein
MTYYFTTKEKREEDVILPRDKIFNFIPPIHTGPSGSNYQPTVPVVQYVANQQQPIPSSTNTTVVVRDSGPSYAGDAVVGMAAGAVMGAALSNIGAFEK